MKLLFVVAFLCITPPAMAQGLVEESTGPVVALRDVRVPIAPDATWNAPLAEARASAQARPQSGDLFRTVPRPRMSGSTTGYIDNAVIGSQVRVRFDLGYGNEALDRAEFYYAKCGCYREVGLDPDAPGPAPALDGRDPATTRFVETGMDYKDFYVDAEYALNQRFSVFATVPVRSISPQVNASATGLGDVRAGLKIGLVATDATAVTFQFRSYFASGDARRGLGTNHASTEFSLLFHQKLSDRGSLAAEFGDWHPIGGSSAIPAATGDFSGDVLRWGAGASYDLVAGSTSRFATVLELVGWRVLGGYWTQSTDGTGATVSVSEADGDIVNLKIGGRLTINGRNSIYVGYGFPLTNSEWYDDIVRLEYRFVF